MDTPAERFTHHLNDLTRGIGDLGLYWRGDLAQFAVYEQALVHVCGHAIWLDEPGQSRSLDALARIATTHLLSCELRQGQAPMPAPPERRGPGTTA